MKTTLLLGTDTGGVLWRPQQPVKILHMQRDGSFAGERPSGALQGESHASVADHSTHTGSTSPAEKACIKTVRATMFEHHVQRHTVAADHLGAEPPPELTNELSGNCRGLWVGKAAEPKTFSKEAPLRQLDILVDAEKPRKASSSNKERVLQDTTWKKCTSMEECESPTPKHVGDSLMCQRIEPRYEILQTVGKRAQSEAIAVVCEDKAVTLRSRRSLKERRRPSGSFVGASWSHSLDLKRDCWKEDSLVSRMKEGGEVTAEADTLQACNVSRGQRAFWEQAAELDKDRVGQKHITAKASCLTSGKKDVGAAEDKVSGVSSELEKEKSRGKTEGSKVPKRLPENFGAGPCGMDGGDTGVSVSQSTAPGSPSEPERHLSGSGQWQTVPHHCADMKNYKAEEPKGSVFRKDPPAHRVQEALDAASHGPEGPPFQRLEEQVKTGSHRASAGKASERWRRKTLPHSIRFEDSGALAEEGVKVLIRRDSLQFHEGSMAKKSRKPRCVVEPKEGASVSLSSPEDSVKDQPSPSKPKVTYFAVTCQIPNEAEGGSGKGLAHKSRWFSSLAGNASLPSNAGASRRAHPPSDRQFCAAASDPPGSSDGHFGKSREEAGEGDASALLRKGALSYPVREGRDESRRFLERLGEDVQGRRPGMDPPLPSAGASSPGKQQPPSYLRHSHQDGDHVAQKQHSDCSRGVSKEKTADNYRSRVLDIDALMAEYKEDALKSSVIQDRREGEESSLFPWEKCRTISSDKTSFSYSRKNPQARDDSPRSRSAEVCRPERERLDSRDPSSVQLRDGKFSPPPWERPSTRGCPAGATSTKKKTFILDEELGANPMWPQGVKSREHKMQIPDPLWWDLKVESGFAPHPSLALAESTLQKGRGPKQQGTAGVPPEGDGPHASSLGKRTSGVVGSLSSSSAGQSPAERNASTLAKASPDFRHPSSEKTPQAKAKGSLPAGPEARERRDQHKSPRQSFPPEQAGHVRLSRRSASQQRTCEEEKVSREEELRLGEERKGGWVGQACEPLGVHVVLRSPSRVLFWEGLRVPAPPTPHRCP